DSHLGQRRGEWDQVVAELHIALSHVAVPTLDPPFGVVTGQAVIALAGGTGWAALGTGPAHRGHHQLALLQLGPLGSGYYPAQVLVAQHQAVAASGGGTVAVVGDLQVGAADPDLDHLDLNRLPRLAGRPLHHSGPRRGWNAPQPNAALLPRGGDDGLHRLPPVPWLQITASLSLSVWQ